MNPWPRISNLCFAVATATWFLLTAVGFESKSGTRDTKVWTTSTFLEFSEGTLADGGANTYVTAAGEVRLINEWDLNQDGFLDVVFPNTHDNKHNVDLFIYWGIQNGSVRHRTRLPSDGGVAQTIADLNRDGFPDLVVANNFNGVKTNLNSYIYWGAQTGFDAGRRTELPTLGATAVAAADLNADGYLELVFANSGRAYSGLANKLDQSYIYWGAASGFSAKNVLGLPTAVASDVKVADLDRDGMPEIVFANEGNDGDEAGAMIYWGKANGQYAEQHRTLLPGERSSAVAIADLNGDGNSEIVLANRYRPLSRVLRETYERDTDVDVEAISSTIFWGSSQGYSKSHRTDLPTLAASAVAAGDLNADGYVDLVFANGPRRLGHASPTMGSGSYIYWGGPQGYVVRQRTILRTMNPTHCLIDDLNADGFVDLVFSNENDARSFETQSYVYWGGPEGFAESRRLELRTVGAGSAGVADFDRDGQKDLVFINKMDGSAGDPLPAYVYWGNEQGNFTVDRRQSLPHPFGSPGEGYAAADLNNDGFVDLYLGGPESAVYWGSGESFSADRKTVVSPRMVFTGRAADFNRDGYLDLVLSEYAAAGETDLYWGGPMGFAPNNRFTFKVNGPRWQSIADLNDDGYVDVIFPTLDRQVILFWNSPAGFENSRKTVLPAGESFGTEVADLNRDGRLDLIVTNTTSDAGSNGNTMIFWGSQEGYTAARRQILPSEGADDALVADLNGDGHLDLVISSYHAGETRSHPSYIYWNSAQGFDASRVTLLPTNSASGILAADFNRDGNLDLLFACHTLDGDHRNDSFLYWGTSKGFSAERRSLLPGLGPHLLTGADIGNIHDRSERFDYVSKVFDAGSSVRFETLTWKGKAPFATQLQFQVRAGASPEALQTSAWAGPRGPNSFYQDTRSSLKDQVQNARYFQFKASLLSPDGANSPVLESVSVEYRR